MLPTKKVLSVLLAAIMLVSVLSCFCISGAEADNVNRFIYSPFEALEQSPGYGKRMETNLVFVAKAWENIPDGKRVYMKYDNEVFWAIKGDNAYDSIAAALQSDKAGDNMQIKVGPGVYNEDVEVKYGGIKFYGNFAGTNPNDMDHIAPETPYKVELNPVRAGSGDDIYSSLESHISGCLWQWTTKGNNTTLDGFTVDKMGKGHGFKPYVGGQHVEYFYFYNNIVTENNYESDYFYLISQDGGWSTGTYVRYNRVINNRSLFLLLGGSMVDTVMDYNYFENNTKKLYRFSSCGNNSDKETLISFSHNIVNTCAYGVNIDYTNAGYGANLDYKRITDNIFYRCGGGEGYIIHADYLYEYFIYSTSTVPTVCTDPRCKTLITNNEFYDIPDSVIPVYLAGGGKISGKFPNYIATITNNKFIFNNKSTVRTAIYCTFFGTADASKNFYGTTVDRKTHGVVSFNPTADNFVAGNDTKLVYLPYYTDYAMTKLGGSMDLQVMKLALKKRGFQSITIDNAEAKITAQAQDAIESVNFNSVININYSVVGAAGDRFSYAVYKDFVLSDPADNNILDIEDEKTMAYLLAEDALTGTLVKYEIVVLTNTDKNKCDLRAVIDSSTKRPYADYTVSGTDVNVNLYSKYVNFPIVLSVSPSATYALYSDEECTQPYVNETDYIAPDISHKVYAKITSGNGQASKVYTITLRRPGSDAFDARILSFNSPAHDIYLFNNERKNVIYRPYSMIDKEAFDLVTGENTTYTVYRDYDEATGTLSEPLSSKEEVKEIEIGDGICYFYVEVKNTVYTDYSQVYTLVVYNDVKSTDNIIRGIAGINTTIDENNVITVEASSTLSVVNARFDTNPFADVAVYADAARTFRVNPSITMDVVNHRDVEVKTFNFGIASQIAVFYVDVTAEAGGDPNQYQLIITKGSTSVPFADIERHWSKDYVNEAARLGILNGYHNEDTDVYTFAPDQFATRQEIAAVLCRMHGIEPRSFKDVSLSGVYEDADDISDWAFNYVKAAYALGIMKGTNDGGKLYFLPSARITRQEFFQSIANLQHLDIDAAADYDLSRFKDVDKISKWAVPAVKAVVKAGIIEGAGGYLNPTDNIKRGEIAKIATIINSISGFIQ